MNTSRTAFTGLLLLTAPLVAQATWTQLQPAALPPGIAAVMGAVTPTHLLSFGGGVVGGSKINDLYMFDGASWSQAVIPTGAPIPPGRRWYSATYDGGRGKLVVFGGQDNANVNLADTWEYDMAAGTWADVTPATGPSARRWSAMCYDPLRGRTLMHGGFDTAYIDQTWEWDGVAWSQLATANTPGARGRYRLVHDPVNFRIVGFGGLGPAGYYTDTIAFDSITGDWTVIPTATVPTHHITTRLGLIEYGLGYDTQRSRIVMGGGYNVSETYTTWEFDGADWTRRDDIRNAALGGVVQPLSGVAMGFVQAQGKSYLAFGFGGNNTASTGQNRAEVYSYQSDRLASVVFQGAGCANSQGGQPFLNPTSEPWLGQTFTVATIYGPTDVPLQLIGLAPAIGLDISALGYPGCTLYPNPFLIQFFAPQLSLPIPQDPALAGVQIVHQAAAIDALGAGSFSSMLLVTIGAL